MASDIDSKLVGQLLALFSHDLRNPLSAMQSNAGFLRSVDNIDEDSREAIDDVAIACDGLAHIIDNLEVLSEELHAGPRPEPGRVLAGPLVRDVVSRARRVAHSHGVELQFDDATQPFAVRTAADSCRRALSNLVRNAIQHAPHGSVVHVSLEELSGQGRILVRDGGAAIAAVHAEAVFTAAGQIVMREGGARYGRGAGLLAAALSARAAGATVAVDPVESGCCFELLVPLAD